MKLALVLCAGCNAILGIDEPTRAPTDALAEYPSCETGWRFHAPIELANAGDALADYQVPLTFARGGLVLDGKLRADLADLRVTADGAPLPVAFEPGLTWTRVPAIPAGTSRLELWYGNQAPPAPPSDPVFVNVLSNPSFEQTGGWDNGNSLQQAQAAALMPCPTWASDGQSSLRLSVEVKPQDDPDHPGVPLERVGWTSSTVSQPTTFAGESQYVLRFDLNIAEASQGDSNEAQFDITLGGLVEIWKLHVITDDPITFAHGGLETAAFGQGPSRIALSARVNAGHGPGNALAYFDNLRVRRAVDVEPLATVGDEIACP